MFFIKGLWRLGTVLLLFCRVYSQTILIREPGGKGAAVVDAVADVIRHACIFPDDKLFLRRLAYVESQDGTGGNAYRPGYSGGIWQIDQDRFTATKTAAEVQKYFPLINQDFDVDWTTVTWADLRKPLYSGIAASLYTQMMARGQEIPRSVEEQGAFWFHNYHSSSPSAAYNFTATSALLRNNCQGNQVIDLVFVLDSSSSIPASDFTKALDFVHDVVDGFSVRPEDTRVAVIKYSTHAAVEFYLNSYLTKSQVQAKINEIQYDGGGTNTAEALNLAVSSVFSKSHGSRDGVSKALILVTDGKSNSFVETAAAAGAVRDKGITIYAIGVGKGVEILELHEMATEPHCTHIFLISSYDEISSLRQEIQGASCITPIMLRGEETVTCELGLNSKCIVQSLNISTLEVHVNCSSASMYGSYNNPNPGSAYYELSTVSTPNKSAIIRVVHVQDALYISIQGPSLWSEAPGQKCFAEISARHVLQGNTELVCRQDGVERKCRIPEDLLLYRGEICRTNLWNFPNPCTKEALDEHRTIFPHPYDSERYLMCDLRGKVYIVICPNGELFDAATLRCDTGRSIIPDSTAKPPTTNNNTTNPCTADAIFAGHFFFPYPFDRHKYIQCDQWGHPYLMSCPIGFVWDQHEVTCVVEGLIDPVISGPLHPSVSNPCTDAAIAAKTRFFPYPGDCTRYIECDLWKDAFTMHCIEGMGWDAVALTCVNLGNANCPTRTRRATGQPYDPPCTQANIDAGKLFFPHVDPHKFIHCDIAGDAFVQDCPSNNFFNPLSNTCVDGPIVGR